MSPLPILKLVPPPLYAYDSVQCYFTLVQPIFFLNFYMMVLIIHNFVLNLIFFFSILNLCKVWMIMLPSKLYSYATHLHTPTHSSFITFLSISFLLSLAKSGSYFQDNENLFFHLWHATLVIFFPQTK